MEGEDAGCRTGEGGGMGEVRERERGRCTSVSYKSQEGSNSAACVA